MHGSLYLLKNYPQWHVFTATTVSVINSWAKSMIRMMRWTWGHVFYPRDCFYHEFLAFTFGTNLASILEYSIVRNSIPKYISKVG
ncbi:hypothetical protein GDO78_005094 [Eleutherodactylus coqui]|uniref:Uncharacterized protein n=1 Tax=Eleutherodactylus coqui TaxID=57060 RepID=A0A8J6FJU3_ELECQ|nr:hypothetical protein GDO78_005094 [Eleutherodactylus coqui]